MFISLACEAPRRVELSETRDAPAGEALAGEITSGETLTPREDVGADAEDATLTADQGVARDMMDPMTVDPWFEEHIRPIMVTYCVTCHGETPAGGGPEGFRLDECEPEGVSGAKLMAPRILARGVEGVPSFMPPGAMSVIPESDARLITRWVELGAPCREEDLQTPPPTRYHPEGYAEPATHGASLKRQAEDCRECHGADLRGGEALGCDGCHSEGWRSTCTFCHGGERDQTGAPPRNLDASGPEVFSAHDAHVAGEIHAPFDCDQCHRKPLDVLSEGHIFDATPAQAEVVFTMGLSQGASYEGEGQCSNLYCHGNGRQRGSWSVDQGSPSCASCHPHLSSGRAGWSVMSEPHEDHLREGITCAECHRSVTDGDERISDVALHVNGQVDLETPPGIERRGTQCSGACHGERHERAEWGR